MPGLLFDRRVGQAEQREILTLQRVEFVRLLLQVEAGGAGDLLGLGRVGRALPGNGDCRLRVAVRLGERGRRLGVGGVEVGAVGDRRLKFAPASECFEVVGDVGVRLRQPVGRPEKMVVVALGGAAGGGVVEDAAVAARRVAGTLAAAGEDGLNQGRGHSRFSKRGEGQHRVGGS